MFVVAGGTNWVMDFEAGSDRLAIAGLTAGGLAARATEVGEHLRITLDDGDLYLAWTTLDNLAGQDTRVPHPPSANTLIQAIFVHPPTRTPLPYPT